MRMSAKAESKRLLVIDEVQKIQNWSETVKAEWDRDTRERRSLVVVLLGSLRMLIEKGLTESLMGRFELIRLTYWSYAEMKACFGWSLPQYIYFGGYPGAACFVVCKNMQRIRLGDTTPCPNYMSIIMRFVMSMRMRISTRLQRIPGYGGDASSRPLEPT